MNTITIFALLSALVVLMFMLVVGILCSVYRKISYLENIVLDIAQRAVRIDGRTDVIMELATEEDDE